MPEILMKTNGLNYCTRNDKKKIHKQTSAQTGKRANKQMHKQKAENWNKLTDDCSNREIHKQTHRQNKHSGKCTITWMKAKAY